MPLTIFAFLERLLELDPGTCADRLLARQLGLAEAVFDGIERDFNVIADGDFDFALVVLKLFDRG